MLAIPTLLMVIAAIIFLLGAIGVGSGRINLTNLGLLFLTLALILS